MPTPSKNDPDFQIFLDIIENGEGIEYSALHSMLKNADKIVFSRELTAEEMMLDLCSTDTPDQKMSLITNLPNYFDIINLKLLRAIPASQHNPEKKYERRETRRPPSNIPYVVDNIWEWLRPEHMPNRRHAAYANLTAENALKNATSRLEKGDIYQVYKVEFSGKGLKLARLNVEDAKHHTDIRLIQNIVIKALDKILQSTDLEQKQLISPLFFPCLTKDELKQLQDQSTDVAGIFDKCNEESTFWKSANFDPDSSDDGELFFELTDMSTYYYLK